MSFKRTSVTPLYQNLLNANNKFSEMLKNKQSKISSIPKGTLNESKDYSFNPVCSSTQIGTPDVLKLDTQKAKKGQKLSLASKALQLQKSLDGSDTSSDENTNINKQTKGQSVIEVSSTMVNDASTDSESEASNNDSKNKKHNAGTSKNQVVTPTRLNSSTNLSDDSTSSTNNENNDKNSKTKQRTNSSSSDASPQSVKRMRNFSVSSNIPESKKEIKNKLKSKLISKKQTFSSDENSSDDKETKNKKFTLESENATTTKQKKLDANKKAINSSFQEHTLTPTKQVDFSSSSSDDENYKKVKYKSESTEGKKSKKNKLHNKKSSSSSSSEDEAESSTFKNKNSSSSSDDDFIQEQSKSTKNNSPSIRLKRYEKETFSRKIDGANTFLDDVKPKEKIFLLQVPIKLDPSRLVGVNISLSEMIRVPQLKKYNSIPVLEPHINVSLFCNNSDERIRILQPTGYIKLQKRLKETSVMEIPNVYDKSVSFPDNLKERHPLFSSDFTDKITLQKHVEEKLQANVETYNKKKKKEKKKKKKRRNSNNEEQEEEIFKFLNQSLPSSGASSSKKGNKSNSLHNNSSSIVDGTKSKKKKKQSLDTSSLSANESFIKNETNEGEGKLMETKAKEHSKKRKNKSFDDDSNTGKKSKRDSESESESALIQQLLMAKSTSCYGKKKKKKSKMANQ